MADILQGDDKNLTGNANSSDNNQQPAAPTDPLSGSASMPTGNDDAGSSPAPQGSVPPTDPAPSDDSSQLTATNDPLLTNKVHPDDLDSKWTSWKCLVCGYVYEGQKEITTCPRCGNSDPDKFDDPT